MRTSRMMGMQEILTVERRRRWTEADKRRIVEETLHPGRLGRGRGRHRGPADAASVRPCPGSRPHPW